MGSVIGIPTTRLSNLYVRDRLMSQLQLDQLDLFRLQVQMSTGHRIQMPSEDPNAAGRIVSLQRLLERKQQMNSNLSTNQSFLSATDSSLSSVSGNLAEIRGVALGVLDTVSSDTQRRAAAQQVRQLLSQLLDTANQQFRGRYLFAGSTTTVQPFEELKDGLVQYNGNEQRLASFEDIDLLFDTNLQGNEVFGAISERVRGSKDLDPAVTSETRLADLNTGQGVASGSIEITYNNVRQTVNLDGAHTLGDVAQMIHAASFGGQQLNVEIYPRGLIIESPDASKLFAVREVGGGSTAGDLGIRQETLVARRKGDDLDPKMVNTSRLDGLLGTRAYTVVRSVGANNDLIFSAKANGEALNGKEVVVHASGSQSVDYDGTTLTINIVDGTTTAEKVIELLENDPIAGALFTASLDPLDGDPNDGSGKVVATDPAETPVLHDGEGETSEELRPRVEVVSVGSDNDLIFRGAQNGASLNGKQIVFQAAAAEAVHYDGDTLTFDIIDGTTTALDVIALLAADPEASLLFTAELDPLDGNPNTGLGPVHPTPIPPPELGGGEDGSIDKHSGLRIYKEWDPDNPTIIGLTEAVTVEDFLNAVNTSGAGLLGEINADGMRLDLRSRISGADFAIGENGGLTATDIGLRSFYEDTRLDDLNHGLGVGTYQADGTYASESITWEGANNDFTIRAKKVGSYWNDFSIQFVENVPAGPEALAYDSTAKTMVFSFNPGVTTANDIKALLAAHPEAGEDFEVVLDVEGNVANDGEGVLGRDRAAALHFKPTGANNDLDFFARQTGEQWNDFPIRFLPDAVGPATLDYTHGDAAMVFHIDPAATNALEIIALVAANPDASADFSVGLAAEGGGNTGLGLVSGALCTMDGGEAIETSGGERDTLDPDFVIELADGGVLQVNVDGLKTIGDVVAYINQLAEEELGPNQLEARFVTTGNGIQLIDKTGGAGEFQIVSIPGSTAAVDLGLIPEGETSSHGAVVGDEQILDGRDTNPLETEGIFTSLLRLQAALERNDIPEAQRAIEMLDEQTVRMNFSRAELGAREQGLDVMQQRLVDENIELQAALSQDYDVDMIEAISQFTGRQIAYQAALQSSASIYKMTLLDYL